MTKLQFAAISNTSPGGTPAGPIAGTDRAPSCRNSMPSTSGCKPVLLSILNSKSEIPDE